MRIVDFLYFAPGVKFDEVNLNGYSFPEQFGRRIDGFYIEPAEECVKRGYTFAAGALLVSCVDALARLRFGGPVGKRFRKFVREELHSFRDGQLAERFYEDFRNGLVHECRLKHGGQFSLETRMTVVQASGILIVNPGCLATEVRAALRLYLDTLNRDQGERARLANHLTRHSRNQTG